MTFFEDDRFTVMDARKMAASIRRGDAIRSQSRKVMLTLAPGELHPRERIALLERQLADCEAERQELAREVLMYRQERREDDE
jgi:hypothetical protein